jgi:hypothetical protein
MAEKIIKVCPSELWRIENAAQTLGDYLYIKNAVTTGKMEFFKHGECYFVTALEMPQRELVIVCAEGKNLRSTLDALRQKAKDLQYKTVRIHCFSHAMTRLIKKNTYDWREAETVFRLEV